jgi:hypothetical protein
MSETTNLGGAPEGNQNAKAGSLVRGAIRRALAENEAKGRQSLLAIAHKLIDQAEAGELPFAKELFDRIDGKANQPVTGEDGGDIKHSVTVRFVGD